MLKRTIFSFSRSLRNSEKSGIQNPRCRPDTWDNWRDISVPLTPWNDWTCGELSCKVICSIVSTVFERWDGWDFKNWAVTPQNDWWKYIVLLMLSQLSHCFYIYIYIYFLYIVVFRLSGENAGSETPWDNWDNLRLHSILMYLSAWFQEVRRNPIVSTSGIDVETIAYNW